MESFLPYYFELFNFVKTVDEKCEERQRQWNKIVQTGIIQNEFLKDFFIDEIRVHQRNADFVKVLFKHLDKITNSAQAYDLVMALKENKDKYL